MVSYGGPVPPVRARHSGRHSSCLCEPGRACLSPSVGIRHPGSCVPPRCCGHIPRHDGAAAESLNPHWWSWNLLWWSWRLTDGQAGDTSAGVATRQGGRRCGGITESSPMIRESSLMIMETRWRAGGRHERGCGDTAGGHDDQGTPSQAMHRHGTRRPGHAKPGHDEAGRGPDLGDETRQRGPRPSGRGPVGGHPRETFPQAPPVPGHRQVGGRTLGKPSW